MYKITIFGKPYEDKMGLFRVNKEVEGHINALDCIEQSGDFVSIMWPNGEIRYMNKDIIGTINVKPVEGD